MGATRQVLVRDATEADIGVITEIYAHYVLASLATFEVDPPDAREIRRRWVDLAERKLPYLAAEVDGRLAGYAYAAPYRPRIAYRFSLEDSIYVHPMDARRGVGRALLGELIERSAALGYRQMIAVIGDSGNAGSIGLHAAFGFTHAGTLRSVGYKFGRWVDTVFMQRALGAGDETLPGG